MEPIDVKKLSNDNILELFQIMISRAPEQEKINKAQELIDKYKNIPESLDGCLYQLYNNTDADIRQFSTLILYKSIDHNWNKISDSKKEEIKQSIIKLYSQEKNIKC